MEELEALLEGMEGTTSLRVSMGEEVPHIHDDRLHKLAHCIYNRRCSHSPGEIYNLVSNEEWSEVTRIVHEHVPIEREYCNNHKVLDASLCDLCPSMVHDEWCPLFTTRWYVGVFSFDSHTKSSIASKVSSLLFRVANAVLWILSDALDEYDAKAFLTPCDEWIVTSKQWINLVEDTVILGTATTIVVLYPKHRTMYSCVVVSHEWNPVHGDPCTLQHAGSSSISLRFVRQTFHGVVELIMEESESEWPPFLFECLLFECRSVSPAEFPCTMSSSACAVHSLQKSCQKRKIDVDTIPDRFVRTVVRAWNKSYNSTGSSAPTLLSIAHVTPLESIRHKEFSAQRVHSLDSTHGQNAQRVLVERFGSEYARGAMDRTLRDMYSSALYAVYNRFNECVSVFGVIYYTTSCRRLACCIDSFAVSSSHQGSGVGNATFHGFLRGSCAYLSLPESSYFVFAQCVRTGEAKHFWYDKLDDSSCARSLMLQAFDLDMLRIPIQPATQCAPRAREYRSSNLEANEFL